MSDNGTQRVRASDAEREQVASVLRDAMSEGRLTLDEGEERLATVYATTYRDELVGLTADLPPGGPPASGPSEPAGATDAHRGGRTGGRRGYRFPRPLGLVAIAALLIGIWALSPGQFFWPAIPLGILVLAAVKHANYRHWHDRTHPGWPRHHHEPVHSR